MKTKKYYFLFAIVIGILCVPVLGQEELSLSGEKPFLIGRANPALAGIKELYVFIVPPDSEPNKDGLVWEELQTKIEHKLEDAGIRYVKPRSLPTAELRVYVDMLKLPDSQKYVFRIQTSLARTVTLPAQRNLHLQVDVWKTEPVMQAVSAKDMPTKVTGVVLEQIETFIHAYSAANRPVKQAGDANEVAVVPKARVKAVAKPVMAEYKYVASKNSKVFHKPDCTWAQRIAPKNLVGYTSRTEAIKAGKRPCKICKP